MNEKASKIYKMQILHSYCFWMKKEIMKNN